MPFKCSNCHSCIRRVTKTERGIFRVCKLCHRVYAIPSGQEVTGELKLFVLSRTDLTRID